MPNKHVIGYGLFCKYVEGKICVYAILKLIRNVSEKLMWNEGEKKEGI